MELINQMIRTKRLFEFVTELVQIRNEELDEKTEWECWLHKDFERSFSEFKEEIKRSIESAKTSSADLAVIVNQSEAITASFVPPND